MEGQSAWFVSARSERYNHELEELGDTDEDENEVMFQSFSSCSPRYSRVYQKFEELREVCIPLDILLFCSSVS